MAQEHFDRLTAIDASFLAQESPVSHMHIGAMTVFDGPPPPFEDFLDTIRERLHLVPRYRQKLSFPPAESGRPVWVDDPGFNLEFHMRQSALPHPGTHEQLLRLASRIFSQQLDRSKPLWEIWMIEGLADDSWALISKTHHAMIDGVSGVDLATVLFDLQPEGRKIEHPDEAWQPEPEPTSAELIASGAVGAARTAVDSARRVADVVLRPQHALSEAREAAEGIGEIVWAGLNPAPPTPLNVEIGPHRRYRVVRADLAEFKAIKSELGGTVNDVVLAVVSGALRDWLHSRGVRTEGLELRALVPVSVRSEGEHDQLGNRLVAMRGPLPVYIDDPVARLRVVRQAMDGLKQSKQAVGASVLAGAQGFAPPTVLAQASRLNFSTRLFNLIVTNIPGPQFPLYMAGCRLRHLTPIAFLPRNHALAIAIMSYDGELSFGLLGDYDALPDIDRIASGLRDSIDELTELTREQAANGASHNGRGARRPVPTAT
jgi:WS/DGAT/MGAT family acyltransferase